MTDAPTVTSRDLPLRLPVPGPDVAAATESLAAVADRLRAHRPRATGDLQLSLGRSGLIRLTRRNQYGRSSVVHPVITGRLVAGPAGVELVGSARPSRFAAVTTAGMALCAVPLLFTGIVRAAGLDTDGTAAWLVLLGVVVALALVVRWDARRPRRGFADEVEELRTALAAELPPAAPGTAVGSA